MFLLRSAQVEAIQDGRPFNTCCADDIDRDLGVSVHLSDVCDDEKIVAIQLESGIWEGVVEVVSLLRKDVLE